MSNLKKFREARHASRRHTRLMRAADHLIYGRTDAELDAADLIALVFGRHQLRITETEAVNYLNAGLVRRSRTRRLAVPNA
ncbi:hypothetical protein [Streptomyces sp. NPDC058092]|uniref:hypothetical protein n=1 Tax=Streptomyces sp. NPDC058092 TaxID=3346336 RepID=UPI0036E4757B